MLLFYCVFKDIFHDERKQIPTVLFLIFKFEIFFEKIKNDFKFSLYSQLYPTSQSISAENNKLKGIGNRISSDPLFREWHVRFTTVSLIALSDQV